MEGQIRIVLASGSKFFLEGTHKILTDENSIKIIAKASNREEIEKCLIEVKPKFLILDKRTLELDVNELLSLIAKKSPYTKVILLSNQTESQLTFPNVIYLHKKTKSSELIRVIKRHTTKRKS